MDTKNIFQNMEHSEIVSTLFYRRSQSSLIGYINSKFNPMKNFTFTHDKY